MTTVVEQIRAALDNARVRNAVSQAIMARLQGMHGITEVMNVTFHQGEMWTVTYR